MKIKSEQGHVVQTGDMKAEQDRLSAKGFSNSSCYQHSFGPMANKTRYVDAWNGIDGKSTDVRGLLNEKLMEGFQRIQQKALGPTTGGGGTAGYALIPVFVDPRLVDQSRKYTPMVELIPRVTNLGMTADYNVITAKGGAFTANADAPLTETNDTYDRASTAIKFLYSVGRVLGPMQAAMPSYLMEAFLPSGAGNVTGSPFSSQSAPNAKQLEVLMKARAMKELEENLIWNGNTTTDATQYDGLIALQSTTNQLDADSGALTWKNVETAIQYAFDDGGRPNLGVGSSSVMTDLRTIMIDTFRTPPQTTEIVFGIPSAITIQTMVGAVPVIPSMYLSNTSGAKQLWFLDTDFIEMRVLQDMTYEELAKTNDSSKFMLKIYECLICRSTGFNAFIDNIL